MRKCCPPRHLLGVVGLMVIVMAAGGCRDGTLFGPDVGIPPRHSEGSTAMFYSSDFGVAEESTDNPPWVSLGLLPAHRWFKITGTA
jgi:hypothetical protein